MNQLDISGVPVSYPYNPIPYQPEVPCAQKIIETTTAVEIEFPPKTAHTING